MKKLSHVSPGSCIPFPHVAQSRSFWTTQPSGQHASPVPQVVIVDATHSCWHAVPACVETLHPFVRHVAGHLPAPSAIAVSHFSPGSRTPLPQAAWQSLSFAALQPVGQQPSAFTHAAC
jgi:hypothetical protein